MCVCLSLSFSLSLSLHMYMYIYIYLCVHRYTWITRGGYVSVFLSLQGIFSLLQRVRCGRGGYVRAALSCSQGMRV